MICPRCNGIGFLYWADEEYETACPECGGDGKLPEKDQKHTFESGATSSEHLPGFDMIAEIMLVRMARRLDLGMVKHGKWNYRKGIRDKAFIMDRLNHAFLHLVKAMDQINFDKPMLDDDLAAVAVNIQMAMEYQQATND